ncbi:MAG: hypothetical protein JST92_10535, partial [Deltaproteobacteria bacterium]|nr:hypothetical protein [Deltaproteobacteria bacterium]
MELSLGKRRHEGAVALAKARQVDLVRALSAQGLSAGSLDSDPALQLGVALSGMLEAKADKLTVALSPGLAELADLVRAEAARCGLVPLVGEPLVDAKKYADDRVFVGARLSSEPLPAQDDKSAAKGDEHRLRRLISAGLPVIRFAADSLDAARTIFTNAFAALRAMGAPDLAGPAVEPITLVDGALPGELPALTTGTLTAYTSPLLTMMLPQIAGTLGSAAKASCAHWIAALLAMSDAGDALVLSLHGAKAEQISELAQT